jgi:hypothetical protein
MCPHSTTSCTPHTPTLLPSLQEPQDLLAAKREGAGCIGELQLCRGFKYARLTGAASRARGAAAPVVLLAQQRGAAAGGSVQPSPAGLPHNFMQLLNGGPSAADQVRQLLLLLAVSARIADWVLHCTCAGCCPGRPRSVPRSSDPCHGAHHPYCPLSTARSFRN